MKKKIYVAAVVGSVWMMTGILAAAGVSAASAEAAEAETRTATESETEKEKTSEVLEDGTYEAEFHTDSSMFHVNEAMEGKGVLTVKEGEMTLHISMPSENILNLFAGTAEDAQKEGAELLEPTTDTVTYQDGMTEEVYGFDVPVPVLDEEFDLALVGTKGKWYDHKVSVTDPVKKEESEEAAETETAAN